jgi:hypothetical protein
MCSRKAEWPTLAPTARAVQLYAVWRGAPSFYPTLTYPAPTNCMRVPVLDSYLGTRFTPSYRYMPANSVKRNRRLENTLVVSFRDGPTPNECIRMLLDNTSSMPYPWSGPMVVFKYEG